ncbi:BadF/BadG/BcrA/BcrD ATPase family protein [Acidianus brierleyi]|uniref:N-acetylglucosamine kinase n=1 Tax=Acidianus brierleyi TaxID=41673 RepID=A0A2U9IGW5_9CREN|nr:BadF/BadG/BcrA/BcrD ATPase family protein [Acidianus brierleyi]AWR95215.1 N-acetylglucosamine kinase [Acidianus brierleyi]
MILAVDGGATKTVAAVYKDEILGVGISSSGNYTEVGEEQAKKNIMEAINDALNNSSVSLKEINKAVFALAGVGDSKKFTEIGERIAKDIFKDSIVMNDGVSALRATNLFNDGAVFAPGTGSVAFYQKNGEIIRVGGWGWFFGDEGSASWIAKNAITYAIRSVDKIEKESKIPEEVEKFFGGEFREVVTRLSKEQNKRLIASFAVNIDKLSKNDELAFKVMKNAAEYIDLMVNRLKKDVNNVYLLGGVMRSSTIRNLMSNKVRYFYGYHSVIGGIITLEKINKEEIRDDLVKQLNKNLIKEPEEKLRKLLFIENTEELSHGL